MNALPIGRNFTINDKEFCFSVATTGLELMAGLRGVTSLGEYDGMFFDFGQDFDIIMTPRGLKFAVDVAFIASDGCIKEIKRLDPDLDFTQAATDKVRYALEVPCGFFEQNDIKIGDELNI